MVVWIYGKDTENIAFLPSTGPRPASSIPIQHGSLNVISGITDLTVKFLELSSNTLRSMLPKFSSGQAATVFRAQSLQAEVEATATFNESTNSLRRPKAD